MPTRTDLVGGGGYRSGGETQMPVSSMTETFENVVERYFAALNDEDYGALMEVFHPDIVLRPPGTRARIGHDEVLQFFHKVFEKFPRHVDAPERVLCDGSCVVVEIGFNGIASNDKEVSFAAVDIFDIEDGRIVGLSQWFDTAEVARQVGVN